YIAYIGLFFIFCYYVQEYLEKNPDNKTAVWGGLMVYMLFFAYLSFRQCTFWKDSGILWTRVIEYYDNTPLPFNNRANFYRDEKMYDRAMSDYNRAIQLKADHPTYNSRAKMFFEKNEDQKALADYNIAIQKKPMAEYYVNRGAAYAKLGRLDEAILDFNKGLEMDPNWKVAYLNRSIMYQQLNNFQGALNDIDSYNKLDPYNPELWYEGARCSRALNRNNEAIPYYNEAIRLNPKFGLAFLERGHTFQMLGNMNAANADYQMAQSLGIKVEPFNPLQAQ
ncbi:MAG: tetratricopeptide repeat protein, partial [Saprospiraceae bacterium]